MLSLAHLPGYLAHLPNTLAVLVAILLVGKSGWQLVGPLGGQTDVSPAFTLDNSLWHIGIYARSKGRSPLRGGAPGSIFDNSMDFDVFDAIST